MKGAEKLERKVGWNKKKKTRGEGAVERKGGWGDKRVK